VDKSRAFKKGSDFEITVFLTLKRHLRDALVMHDVHIPFTPNPAQIDLLVVRGWSFHVLELKNYEHSLSGSIADKRWLAKSDSRSYKIQNPILQNSTQSFKLIQVLKSLGFSPPREIKGFVVVPPTCRLEIDSHLKPSVVTLDSLIRTIQNAKPGEGDIKRLKEVLLAWKR